MTNAYEIKAFFDARTWTLTYVVWDASTKDAVIIDPVLDFDPASGKVWRESLDEVEAFLKEQGLNLRLVLETHAHADHLTGAALLKDRFGVPVGVGKHIADVQSIFAPIFDLDPSVPRDGSQFDLLIADGDVVEAGSLPIHAIHTPGHTPACMTYRIGDALFTGDALFMPDYGVGRCDFPGGSADTLYSSVHDRIYDFPAEMRIFTGHDYQPGGRALRYEATVGESRDHNIQLRADTTREEFVKFRTARDRTLSAPRLLLPSIQVNIDAGRLPPAHENGKRYLLTPLAISFES